MIKSFKEMVWEFQKNNMTIETLVAKEDKTEFDKQNLQYRLQLEKLLLNQIKDYLNKNLD